MSAPCSPCERDAPRCGNGGGIVRDHIPSRPAFLGALQQRIKSRGDLNRVCRLGWLFGLLWVVGPKTCIAQTSEPDYQAKAHDLFVTVERTARLPALQQTLEIPRIYSDVWPILETEMLTAEIADFRLNRMTIDERNLTPEELATIYQQHGDWAMVAKVARGRCRRLLALHADEVEDLAREDLRSKDQKRLWRGLRAAGDFRLAGLYDDVTAQLNGSEDVFAGQALRELDELRAIPLLARHGIKGHFEVLRGLQRGRPANSELLALLNDKDAQIRWRAAYALAESGDPRLAPIVERLARDAASEVRVQAACIAFSLPSDAFVRLRVVLVALLGDNALNVRSSVVILFAARKDPVCAKALYDLLAEEEKLESWRQSNLVQALQTLTGSYFGFIPGTISTESARRAALDQFARWILEKARAHQ